MDALMRTMWDVDSAEPGDGSLSVFDGNRGAWTSLPNLPKSVGLGQLLKSGDDLVYAGGFDDKGAPSKTVYALNLNDPLSGWIDKGESDAVEGETLTFSQHLACPKCGKSYDEPAPRNFSFNSPYGACEHCDGLGRCESELAHGSAEFCCGVGELVH